jgi:hypothetical protein
LLAKFDTVLSKCRSLWMPESTNIHSKHTTATTSVVVVGIVV